MDTTINVSHDVGVKTRTGFAAFSALVSAEHQDNSGILTFPLRASYALPRVRMRAYHTPSSSFVDWLADTQDYSAQHSGYPLVDLVNIVYLETILI